MKFKLAKITVIFILTIIVMLATLKVLFSSNCTKLVFNKYIKGAENFGGSYLEDQYKKFNIKDKYKIVIVTKLGGEATYSEYIKYVAHQIGWEAKVYYYDLTGYENEVLKFDPDMILITELAECSFNNDMISSHRSKKYFASAGVSLERYFNMKILRVKNNKLIPKKNLGLLLSKVHGVISPSRKSLKAYEGIFSDMKKKFFGIQLLATPPNLMHTEPAEPKSLIWLGRWEESRKEYEKHQKFIKILSTQIPMKMYGYHSTFNYLPQGVYDGLIPPGIENIEAIRKNGIYLLTHANLHFKDNTPSMRVFEAAAANVVIISDLHPFVVKHFGDSVLYFDQNAKPEAKAKQIQEHVNWIFKNPDKAKELAKKSNQIFVNNFSLDKNYLVRIAKMHEAVLAYEQQLGLSYNLVY